MKQITHDYSNDYRVKSKNKFRYIPENLLNAEERAERIRCKQSYFYFIENFIQVPGLNTDLNSETSSGFVPFKPYDFQIRTIKAFMNYHNVLTFKSRQTGFSILWATFLLWAALFNNNWVAGVVSKDGGAASAFLRKVYDILTLISDRYPFLMQPIDIKNTQSTRFRNGSMIITSASGSNALRSETLSLLLLDEAAFNSEMESIYTAAQPAISRATASRMQYERDTGKKMMRPLGIIINSTPNGKKGMGKWYYDMYKGAKKRGSKFWNRFFLIRAHWREVPMFDDEWYNQQCAELGWDPIKIAQEYDLKFVGDISDIIPPELMQKIVTKEIPLEREPVADTKPNELIKVYEEPDTAHNYIIGVDNAWGDDMLGSNPDSSAFVVIEVETGTPVCTFKGMANAIELAYALDKVGKWYNNALIAVERAATGIDTIILLRDTLGYPNLYIHRKKDKTKTGKTYSKDAVYGMVTNKSTRPVMMSNVLAQIRENHVLNDPELFDQIDTLEFRKGRLEAAPGDHDDLVLAFAIALYVRQDIYKIRPGISNIDEETRIQNRENLLKNKLSETLYKKEDEEITEDRKRLNKIKEVESITGQKLDSGLLMEYFGKIKGIEDRRNKKFLKNLK